MKYKTLMWHHIYVDKSRLYSGVYSKPIPDVYESDETIPKMIARAKEMFEKFPNSICLVAHEDEYIENLKKCKLVNMEISIDTTFDKGDIVKWNSNSGEYICTVNKVKKKDKVLKVVQCFDLKENEKTIPYEYFWLDFGDVEKTGNVLNSKK